MENMKCPYCGNETEWVNNAEIYGKQYGNSFMSYLCRPCDAYVGCHNNTKKSLGTIANKELREARKATHAIIDPLWKNGKYKRGTVYIRLNEAFGEEIHVGESDLQRCKDIQETAKLIFNLQK